MLSRLYILLSISVLFTNRCSAQNYLPYYDRINYAERCFVQNKYDSSFTLYDQAFSLIPQPFIKDYFNASQFALLRGDTGRMYQYISLAFSKGMPREVLGCALMMDSFFSIKNNKQRMQRLYSEKYKRPTFDTALQNNWYYRYYTHCYTKNKLKDVLQLQQVLRYNIQYCADSFLTKGVFPSEKILGIATDSSLYNFTRLRALENIFPLSKIGVEHVPMKNVLQSCSIDNESAYIAFVVDECAFEQYKRLLWKCVQTGTLHPADYALLDEYSWQTSKEAPCRKEGKMVNYALSYKGSAIAKTEIAYVEQNRKNAHLQSYEIDEVKRKLEKRFGLKLFSGHVDCR